MNSPSDAAQPGHDSSLGPIGKNEKRIVAGIIFLVILLTTLPYLLAFSISNTFVGQIYNIVDYSVYLSWTRQAADGHFGTLNLFTTVQQHGYLFNALFLLFGSVVRLTGLPIPVVFQIFRVGGAIVLLWVAYLLCRLTYPSSVNARLTSFGLIALSSGFGFIYWPHWADNNAGNFSVDVWQPEAFTFLSIYTSALFTVATALIATAFYNLVRGEITGKRVYAVYAGVCGLTLGNIHSYDILHIAAAWGLYVIAISIIERNFDKERWLRAFIAGCFTLPTTLYQYWVYQHEPVFHARADTPTLSPIPLLYVIGYGLVFFLALGALYLVVARRKSFIDLFRSNSVMVWIISWIVAGLTIIYIPVQFQRKMVMGEHLPLCILAGGMATWLVQYAPVRYRQLCLLVLVAATFPTNALFLTRDYRHIINNRSEIDQAYPFLTVPQLDVLNWIRHNTRPGQAVLAFQPIGQFVPGYCDRPVWIGHWSETPDYIGKSAEMFNMFLDSTPEDIRKNFILSTGATYLVYPTSTSEEPINTKNGPVYMVQYPLATAEEGKLPSYLTRLYVSPANNFEVQDALAGSYTIYRINR